MPTNIDILTAAGTQQGQVPDEGTEDYYPSLQNIAELLKTACQDSNILKRSVFLGNPDNPYSGVRLNPNAKKYISIPRTIELRDSFYCIPLLMCAPFFQSGSLWTGTSNWQMLHIMESNVFLNSSRSIRVSTSVPTEWGNGQMSIDMGS